MRFPHMRAPASNSFGTVIATVKVAGRGQREWRGCRTPDSAFRQHCSTKEGAIRKFTVNLLGAAALVAAGYALLRQGNIRAEPGEARNENTPAGEKDPGNIRLDKLRELGI